MNQLCILYKYCINHNMLKYNLLYVCIECATKVNKPIIIKNKMKSIKNIYKYEWTP
jgi:hypothetical protein